MRLLLDTHTLLWWHTKTVALSAVARKAIDDPANEVFLSLVNVWEIQIKVQLGKLPLPKPVADLIDEEIRANNFQLLPVTLEHIYGLDALPFHHKDPFDRLLIAQAREEGLTLVSRDTPMKAYSVSLLWWFPLLPSSCSTILLHLCTRRDRFRFVPL